MATNARARCRAQIVIPDAERHQQQQIGDQNRSRPGVFQHHDAYGVPEIGTEELGLPSLDVARPTGRPLHQLGLVAEDRQMGLERTCDSPGERCPNHDRGSGKDNLPRGTRISHMRAVQGISLPIRPHKCQLHTLLLLPMATNTTFVPQPVRQSGTHRAIIARIP